MIPKYGICVADTTFWWPRWLGTYGIRFSGYPCKVGTVVIFSSRQEIFHLDHVEVLTNYGYDEKCFQIIPSYVWSNVRTIQNPHDRIARTKFLASLTIDNYVYVAAGRVSFIGKIIHIESYGRFIILFDTVIEHIYFSYYFKRLIVKYSAYLYLLMHAFAAS